MGKRALQYVIPMFFMSILLCSGTFIKRSEDGVHRLAQDERFIPVNKKLMENELGSMGRMPQLDVVTPMTTVPIINPTTPTTSTPIVNPISSTPIIPLTPNTGPMVGTPIPNLTPTTGGTQGGSSGQSWCIASQAASDTALQVALDYACGYGGADCSAIQSGGSCFNPDTVRDHASYAFNSYYQKNPVSTSCDFGGTAIVTNTDPSTQNCQYPSSSTSSSVPNTTNPYGTASPVFGTAPPDSTGTDSSYAATKLVNITQTMLVCLLMILITTNHL